MNKRPKYNPSAFLVLGLLGLYLSVYQSVLEDLSNDFMLKPSQVGLIISFHFIGSILLPMVLGELSDRVGSKPALFTSFSCIILGLFIFLSGRSAFIFCVGSMLAGGGFAVLEGTITGLLAAVNPDRINSILNLSQMFFCLGACLGPLVVFSVALAKQTWQVSYVFVLVLFIFAMMLFCFVDVPSHRTERIHGLQLKGLLKNPIFMLLLLSIFLYVGIEEGAAFWITSYLHHVSRSAIPVMFFLTAYWLGMGSGRLLFSFINMHYKRWMIYSLLFSFVFVLLFLIFADHSWILLPIFLVGFGFAPVWPVLMMDAYHCGGQATQTAMGSMMASGAAGGATVPFVLGYLAQKTSMPDAMTMLPILLAILIILVILGRPTKWTMYDV